MGGHSGYVPSLLGLGFIGRVPGTSVPGFYIPPLRGLNLVRREFGVAESELPQGLKPASAQLDSAGLKP
jgi:hypothetical protein